MQNVPVPAAHTSLTSLWIVAGNVPIFELVPCPCQVFSGSQDLEKEADRVSR